MSEIKQKTSGSPAVFDKKRCDESFMKQKFWQPFARIQASECPTPQSDITVNSHKSLNSLRILNILITKLRIYLKNLNSSHNPVVRESTSGLWFDCESGQTNNCKIGIHSFPA